nr:MAG TPA: hypothetical protein [Bacteriophage sp.]
MTLIELQNKLGEQIEALTNPESSNEMKKQVAEISSVISSLAKQMINNADIVLRRDKMISEGKLKNSAINKMIGDDN